MQIALLEEQNTAEEIEAAEFVDNEAKPTETDTSAVEPAPRSDGFDGKPDINDVPMEENQVNDYLSIFLSTFAQFLSGVPE